MAAIIITGTLISNSQECFFESKTAQLSLGLEKHFKLQRQLDHKLHVKGKSENTPALC